MSTLRPKKPAAQPRDGELPEEFQLRRLVAKARLKAVREVIKKTGLSTYQAADTGRRNRDWKANNSSADLAIIPDSSTLIGRARQLVRDSWVGKSYVRAFARNVVGKSITINPHAKDRDGKPLTALNKVAQREFTRWAKSKLSDVERKQTFGQKQRLAAKERATAGEHLWMWSYRTPDNGMGGIDRTRPVGLCLQSLEPEQFDLRILSYEGREVRGGVEVDENGAPVAYHIYTRNPNDVLYRHAFFSQRVPAERMLHYFEGERVLQSRGVTPMSPIMQDVRDLEAFKGATLMRARMEACIGLIIKTMIPAAGLQGIQSTIQPAAGDTGQTPSGMTEADFVPGMVPNLQPGEDVVPFVPSSPGNGYDPFVNLTVQGIGAGVGMSRGEILRQSDGNYSSARQDMLADRKEIEPEQELITDDMIRPVYELWFNFAALEGRFDGVEGFGYDEYLAERHRFVEAEYIPPPQTWIDPEKEANAFAIMLKNRLITREEIVAMRGGRFYQIIEKLAVEQQETGALNLTLPEDEQERNALRELVKAILTNKLGTIDSMMANTTDFPALARAAGLPTLSVSEQPLLPVISPPGQLVTGDPVKNSAGKVIGGGVEPPELPPVAPAVAGAAPKGPQVPQVKAPIAKLDAFSSQDGEQRNVISLPQPATSGVPNYGRSKDPAISCGTCSFLQGERCSKFDFVTNLTNGCDDWAAKTLTENIGAPNTAKTFPPGPQPGQDVLENRFFPDADPTPRP